jgi:hypothetical protein
MQWFFSVLLPLNRLVTNPTVKHPLPFGVLVFPSSQPQPLLALGDRMIPVSFQPFFLPTFQICTIAHVWTKTKLNEFFNL